MGVGLILYFHFFSLSLFMKEAVILLVFFKAVYMHVYFILFVVEFKGSTGIVTTLTFVVVLFIFTFKTFERLWH